MKRISFALIALCVALNGTLFTSCSADEAEENDGVYRYTAEQIQEIENLKEDYGVENVNIPYESTSQPLLSLSEVEEVLQIVAAFQNSAKNCIIHDGNSCTFSNEKGFVTRAIGESVETSSGSTGGSKQVYHNGNRIYIKYTVSWHDAQPGHSVSASVTINEFDGSSLYDVECSNCSASCDSEGNVTGSFHVCVYYTWSHSTPVTSFDVSF